MYGYLVVDLHPSFARQQAVKRYTRSTFLGLKSGDASNKQNPPEKLGVYGGNACPSVLGGSHVHSRPPRVPVGIAIATA